MDKKSILIYNPASGQKRNLVTPGASPTLPLIKGLLKKHGIVARVRTTRFAGHATKMSSEAIKQGATTILVAGGDGTVNEVVNALVGTNVTLGIIPTGTFMNTAQMLGIPLDIEEAIKLVARGRTTKIDIGVVTNISGENSQQVPYYFVENAGIGFEARIQKRVKEVEEKEPDRFSRLISTLRNYRPFSVTLTIDKKIVDTRATMVEISNAPMTGASLTFAPTAKLNDHTFTISIFYMSRLKLAVYLAKSIVKKQHDDPTITRYQGKNVAITTNKSIAVHADATIFGQTPVAFELLPKALKVIANSSKKSSALL